MASSPHRPQPTEFDRLIPRRRSYIEAARRYVHRYGQAGAQDAILRDMRAGRLPRLEADHMRGFLLFLLIERICRRIGYTHYGALLLDPEFIHEIAAELEVQARQQGFSKQQREHFALQVSSDALCYWHYVAQDLAGNPVYTVTAALARRLCESPPRELACAALRLPVPALALVVPPEAGLTIEYEGGRPSRVTEIYVVEAPAPERRWFLWLCAPADARVVVTEHLNLELSESGSLEQALQRTAAAHASCPGPVTRGWPQCIRFLAGAMHYLREGGAHHELWLDEEVRRLHGQLAELGPEQHEQGEALRARLRAMDAGKRIVLGEAA
jgi:hypothetical protein